MGINPDQNWIDDDEGNTTVRTRWFTMEDHLVVNNRHKQINLIYSSLNETWEKRGGGSVPDWQEPWELNENYR